MSAPTHSGALAGLHAAVSVQRQNRLLRGAALLAAIACAAPVLHAGGPAAPILPPDAVLAGFRIGVAGFLLLRLRGLWRGRKLLWARDKALPWDARLRIEHVLGLWAAAAVFLGLGLATPVTAATALACELYVFRRSYTHSLEDTLFQLSTFFLILVGAGAALSLDAALGWDMGLPVSRDVVVLLWWLAVAMLMFSAGFEKVLSPIWRLGLGIACFLGLPHLVQPGFRFLRDHDRLNRLGSWAIVIAELALLPALAVAPLRTAVMIGLALFAISLFVVVDLSFIGQLTLLNIAALTALGLAAPPAEPGWIIPGLWVYVCVLAAAVTGGVPLPGLSKLMGRLAGFTVGLKPISVFTDQQLYGIYLYRVVAELEDGARRPLLETFAEDGSCGPMQRWQPRVFLKLTYEVTDLCLLLQRRPVEEVRGTAAFAAAEALMHGALDELGAKERAGAARVVLYVRSVALSDVAAAGARRFVMSDWEALGACPVVHGAPGPLAVLAAPPAVGITARVPGGML